MNSHTTNSTSSTDTTNSTNSTDTATTADPEYDHSSLGDDSERSPFVCSRCSRPFAHEEWLVLHRGLAHEEDLTDDEYEEYVDAHESEEKELRLFRLKALIVIIVIYFGFIMTYSIFA